MNGIGKFATMLVAALAFAMLSAASFAASEFEGVWLVKDSNGTPFEITLSADGKAAGTHDKAKEGAWKEEGGSAVITWSSGWTTKISKEGDKFVKTAFKKDAPLDGPPTNTSDAVKK